MYDSLRRQLYLEEQFHRAASERDRARLREFGWAVFGFIGWIYLICCWLK